MEYNYTHVRTHVYTHLYVTMHGAFGLRFVSRSMNDYSNCLSSFHHEFRRRERRAAESSEERETRLAKRRVANITIGMLQIQTGEQSVAESVALLKALSTVRRD